MLINVFLVPVDMSQTHQIQYVRPVQLDHFQAVEEELANFVLLEVFLQNPQLVNVLYVL